MYKALPLIFAATFTSACSITPEPFTLEQMSQIKTTRLSSISIDQEPVTRTISLHEAMARAIKYNLDYKVELFEEALRKSEAKLSELNMLPRLVASAGLNSRDNYTGSRSSPLLTGNSIGALSESPSTSAEKNIIDADLRLSWDILDFGLSYVRAQQSADQYLISNERKRKVINRIIANVRTAYWRAVSAERLVSRLQEFQGDITQALQASEEAFKERKTAPLRGLHYQRELLEIQQQIQSMQAEMNLAKMQLAALMNIDPSVEYSLELNTRIDNLPTLTLNAEKLVDGALINRPELRELAYEQRVNKKQAEVALLEVLPGLSFFGSFNHNDNKFLYNNNWANWGAQTSWNIVEAFKYPHKKRVVKVNGELLDHKALALTMAVITQVHVSATQFEVAKRKLYTVQKFNTVNQNIREQVLAGYKSKKVSHQTYVRENMNSIVAEAKHDMAYAELQNRYADIFSAIGYQVYGDANTSEMTVVELSDHLRKQWENILSKIDQ